MKIIRKDGHLYLELWLSIPEGATLKEGIVQHEVPVDLVSINDEDAYISKSTGINLHRMLVKVPAQYVSEDMVGGEDVHQD